MRRTNTYALSALLALFTFVIQGCEEAEEFVPSLNLNQTSYTVSSAAQSIEIGISANSDVEAITHDDWINASVKHVNDSTLLYIGVDNFEGVDNDRTGSVEVKLTKYDLTKTITIVQQAKGVVFVDNNVYYLTSDRQTFSVPVKSNCKYEITIPEWDKDWIGLSGDAGTKAVTESSVVFSVDKNESYKSRSTAIILSVVSSDKADTIYVTQEEGINSLAKALREDESISLFYQALVMTGMIDSIRGYIDESFVSLKYDQPGDLTSAGSYYTVEFFDTMYVKYTVFCETDDVLREKYNINTIEQLIQFSNEVYNESFPANANQHNTNYKDRQNPLNRFVSYHILPMGVSYDKLNPVNEINKERFVKWNEMDFEDFYTPMLQHSVLKVSTPYQSEVRYLNRKGTSVSGIAVAPDGIVADNGYAFYLSDVLTYSKYVRENVLDTRLRVLATTLFPEMMSNGAHIMKDDYQVRSFNDRYKRSYTMFSDDGYLYLTYLRRNGYHYMGECIFLNLNTDLSFKLPAVPVDGLYEIRLSVRRGWFKKEYQFYLNNSACGSPFSTIGTENWEELWISDEDLGDEALINACDDTLRAHGFMKGIASFRLPYGDMTFRDMNTCYRYIIASDVPMNAAQDYYLRIKGLDNEELNDGHQRNESDFRLEMIEIVPKKIYDGPVREDKN